MNKKILVPIGSFYPSRAGGPAISVYNMIKYLSEKNPDWCFDVITTSNNLPNNFKSFINLNQNVKIIYLNDNSLKLPLKTISRSLKLLKECDVVYLNSIYFILSIFVFIKAKFLNKKIIWSVRGELYKEAIDSSLKKNIYLFILRLFVKNVTFHVTSNQEKNIATTIFKNSKFLVAGNLITQNYFDFKLKPKKITFIGRLVPHKRVSNLIKAFLESNLTKKGFELYIAGSGSSNYVKNLKEISNNKIFFLGYLDKDQKNKLLQDSIALFLPSKSENYGNVILESLSYGSLAVAPVNSPWKDFLTSECLRITNGEIDDLVQHLNFIGDLNNNELIKINKESRLLYEEINNKNKININKIFDE
jgi:glycosyltransferase involved in cell wall biosynthesis